MAELTETDILSGGGEEDEDENNDKTIDGFDTTFNGDGDINEDYINKLFSIKRKNGTRPNKTYDKIKEALEDFKIPKLSRDINTYRRYFLDIIINGNFRVKYIPLILSLMETLELNIFHLVLLVNQPKITAKRDLMKMEHLHIVYYIQIKLTLMDNQLQILTVIKLMI